VVRTSRGAPLAGAVIRLYEPRCTTDEDCFGPHRTPPWLRAITQTDDEGAFVTVVPAAPR
jgi:hypothetical protein